MEPTPENSPPSEVLNKIEDAEIVKDEIVTAVDIPADMQAKAGLPVEVQLDDADFNQIFEITKNLEEISVKIGSKELEKVELIERYKLKLQERNMVHGSMVKKYKLGEKKNYKITDDKKIIEVR